MVLMYCLSCFHLSNGKIMSALNNLTYAPIIQVAVGIKNSDGNVPVGFGDWCHLLKKDAWYIISIILF